VEEQAFFEEGYVAVPAAVIGNQTYPVANTSIRTDLPPTCWGPSCWASLEYSTLFGLSDSVGAFVWRDLLGVAIVRWRQAKSPYTIFFGTAGGELKQRACMPIIERVRTIDKHSSLAGKLHEGEIYGSPGPSTVPTASTLRWEPQSRLPYSSSSSSHLAHNF